jgi:disulfide bond formation protein DsbB
MYPIALILLIGLFNKKIIKAAYISVFGFGVGLYHIYLQNGGGPGGSCAVDVPCNLKYVDIFGFISIPVMASTGFLTIFLSLLYYDLSRKETVE